MISTTWERLASLHPRPQLPQEASLSQDAAGSGSMSLAMSGTQGSREAGGDASVAFGELSSAQSIYVGQDAALSSLSAAMAGQEGYVGTGAFSDSNAMLAAGSFQGAGVLEAQLSFDGNGAGRGRWRSITGWLTVAE